jgi:hypothetical protein
MRGQSLALNTESLTYWYFRLNGFFTIPNFVVHPDRGSRQRTDVDVLGIRFPHRNELRMKPMEDDTVFTHVGNKAFLAIAEVKTGLIAFNTTWTDPRRENIQRFLAAAGVFVPDNVDAVAHEIYERGCFSGDRFCHVSLVGIGRRRNSEIQKAKPDIPQITWYDIGRFVFWRFNRYTHQKRSHAQWDMVGQQLWNVWEQHQNSERDFCTALLTTIS